MLNFLLAFAPPAADGKSAPGSGMSTIIMMVLFMVIFWVLLIRPQKKRQKEHEARLSALKSGDRVITSGGIHGIITTIRDRSITVKIAEGVRIDIEKAAVATVLPKDGTPGSSSPDTLAQK